MGLIGTFVCACGYRSRPILMGAYDEPYDLPLGSCTFCREIFTFDPDRSYCLRCGHTLMRLAQDEDGEAPCPRCGRMATLQE